MKLTLLLTCLLPYFVLQAQENSEWLSNIEITAEEESVGKDDSYIQKREYLLSHPLFINNTSAAEWEESGLLNEWQLESFLEYRRLLGPFVSLYELQSIPGWDIEMIRQLLPFIRLKEEGGLLTGNFSSLPEGNHMALLRWGRKNSDTEDWVGSPISFQARYKITYRNVWQMGLLADKDAGEPFLDKWNRKGFDFYSFHFFVRKQGRIEALALGDYTVNMGQGLMQWQQLAFKKGAGLGGIKRQGPVFRPYSSAGEYNFHRGAAVSLQYGQWHWNAFASFRRLDANIYKDSSNGYSKTISSLLKGGLHRTWAEAANRNQVLLTALGGSFQYKSQRFKAGINTVQYHFSLPVQRIAAPYNIYSLRGDQWANYSFDYSYTYRNFHFFGEVAVDTKKHPGLLQGVLMALDTKLDMAIVFRNLHKAYQALFSNAFTERTDPGNEKGMYCGITLRPFARWQIEGYIDWYRFPWLQYQVDKPGYGNDYLFQISYLPSKATRLTFRYREETKSENDPGIAGIRDNVKQVTKKQTRFQFDFTVSKAWRFRSRVDIMALPSRTDKELDRGFSAFTDFLFTPPRSLADLTLRIHLFETDSYASRVYAFENDLLFSNSIPAFSGRGFRWYLLGKIGLASIGHSNNKINIRVYMKFSQTLEREDMGSNNFRNSGKLLIMNDLKFQIITVF